MPKGLPTSQDLTERVRAFSLDTCAIESAGFRFSSGSLAALRRQLPPFLKLYLSEVVLREVVDHMTRNSARVFQHARSAVNDIQRVANFDVQKISKMIDAMAPSDGDQTRGREELRTYLSAFNGEVVAASGRGLMEEVLRRYFDEEPPFEQLKDKKHEFPDATALITLDRFAARKRCSLILVSNDRGWHDFAAQSERLYCVNSLEELAALYASEGKRAAKVKSAIGQQFLTDSSPLFKTFWDAITDLVYENRWAIEAESEAGFSVDAEVDMIDVEMVRPDVEEMRVWLDDQERKVCVVEIGCELKCRFEISGEFSKHDSVDRDWNSMGTGTTSVTESFDSSFLVTIEGNLASQNSANWEVRVDLVDEGVRTIHVGNFDPDWYNDGRSDD